MPFNTALFVIHAYEISCKINLFKSSFLSSKINSVEKKDSIFLVDAGNYNCQVLHDLQVKNKEAVVNIITKICHSSLTT